MTQRRGSITGRRWLGLAALGAMAAAAVLCPGPAAATEAAHGASPRPAFDGAAPDVLGSLSVRAPTLVALPRWRAVLAAFEDWRARVEGCATPACTALPEKILLARAERLRLMPLPQRVAAAAAFVDQVLMTPSPTESAAAGTVDLSAPWPTLHQILVNGARGPLARTLAKYFTLRMGGVPADQLRLVVARDTLSEQLDMFVVVDLPGQPRVGLVGRGLTPLTRDQAAFHVPLYSFDETSRWIHMPRARAALAAAPGRPTGTEKEQ